MSEINMRLFFRQENCDGSNWIFFKYFNIIKKI